MAWTCHAQPGDKYVPSPSGTAFRSREADSRWASQAVAAPGIASTSLVITKYSCRIQTGWDVTRRTGDGLYF